MRRRTFTEMMIALFVSQTVKLFAPSKGGSFVARLPDPFEMELSTSSLEEIIKHADTILLDFNELVCVHMDLHKGNPDDLEIEFVWPKEAEPVIDSMLVALQYTGSIPARVILQCSHTDVRATITRVGIRYGNAQAPTIVCFILHYEGEWE